MPLGNCYIKGTGVPKDLAKAIEWYEKAAQAGELSGLNYLGVCYMQGIGVRKNEKKGVECFEKAAKAGDAYSLGNLGWCYDTGHYFYQEPAEGRGMVHERCERRRPELVVLDGQSVPERTRCSKDLARAVEWLEKAAGTNHIDAMVLLGMTFEKKQTATPADPARAAV